MLSNEVTLTDVVNAILAVGGTAICGNDSLEVEEIVELCDGLLINSGMPTKEKLISMQLAGKKAAAKGPPILLDPVGMGATSFRRDFIKNLLSSFSFSCIKGNYSEISCLCGKKILSQGIEAGDETLFSEEMKGLAVLNYILWMN